MIYVNPWGSDSNNGKTANKAVATVDRAMQLMGDNTELVFRSGMTFDIDNPMSLPFSNVVIGAYGKGKTPKLVLTSNGNQFKPMFVLAEKLASGHDRKPASGIFRYIRFRRRDSRRREQHRDQGLRF